jgi:hypothetical protein
MKNILLPFLIFIYSVNFGQTLSPNGSAEETFVIENYYKVKWGFAEEFFALYKKNHFPLLKKAMEKGDVLDIVIEKPRQHSTEESRWDYRITTTFKNMKAAFDPNLVEPYKKQLYPDLEKLSKEEQHRFELLISHWDVEVQRVDPDKK